MMRRQLRLDRWGRINWVDRHAKKEIVLKRTRHQFLEAGYGQTGIDIARGMVIINAA